MTDEQWTVFGASRCPRMVAPKKKGEVRARGGVVGNRTGKREEGERCTDSVCVFIDPMMVVRPGIGLYVRGEEKSLITPPCLV